MQLFLYALQWEVVDEALQLRVVKAVTCLNACRVGFRISSFCTESQDSSTSTMCYT
jgi:hypothetical protein